MAEQHFTILLTLRRPDGTEPYTREEVTRLVQRVIGMDVQVDEVHDDTVDPADRQPGAGSAYGMEAERG
jgi:hypothetical protein